MSALEFALCAPLLLAAFAAGQKAFFSFHCRSRSINAEAVRALEASADKSHGLYSTLETCPKEIPKASFNLPSDLDYD